MELHRQGKLTSGLWRGTNQCYFMKRKRRNERKRGWEEKGRAESKMNGCGTNTHLSSKVSPTPNVLLCYTTNYLVCYVQYSI